MIKKEIIQQVSEQLDIPFEVVNKAYGSFWEFIRKKIIVLPLSEDLTVEDFQKLRTNFNVPSLGKLSLTWDRYIGIKQRYKKIKNGRLQEKNVD